MEGGAGHGTPLYGRVGSLTCRPDFPAHLSTTYQDACPTRAPLAGPARPGNARRSISRKLRRAYPLMIPPIPFRGLVVSHVDAATTNRALTANDIPAVFGAFFRGDVEYGVQRNSDGRARGSRRHGRWEIDK
ncbi:hypothetical protein Misp01_81970 [Microtetraspora sp. NBRC 13810]|nr:hypothetical protein Misp01_81970 [Microtetraspora sp. NBRC 13810]